MTDKRIEAQSWISECLASGIDLSAIIEGDKRSINFHYLHTIDWERAPLRMPDHLKEEILAVLDDAGRVYRVDDAEA